MFARSYSVDIELLFKSSLRLGRTGEGFTGTGNIRGLLDFSGRLGLFVSLST
jgi:hypothetical protein